MPRPLVATVLLPLCAVAQQGTPPLEPTPRLRNVEIRTDDVFSTAEADGNLFYALANLLHVTTDPEVIEREVWLQPGQAIDAERAAEVERNLRELGLFGAVHAELRPVGPELADLAIDTRDRFSLTASASAARVGGVDKLSFRLSDSNLLGSGKSLVALSSRAGEQRTDLLSFSDPQFLGSRHVFGTTSGRTEDGSFTTLVIARPFRRLDDPYSYGAEFAAADEAVDFYRFGDVEAKVPRERRTMRLFAAVGDGPRELRQAYGLDLRVRHLEFGAATGSLAPTIAVPGDTDEIEFGPYWTLDWRERFLEVRRLDSLDFDEDVQLGVHAGLRLAARRRDEGPGGAAYEPLLAADLNAAAQPRPDTFVTTALAAELRVHDERLIGHRLGGAVHCFWLGLPAQTLCGSIAIDAASEHEDLSPQFTLGEDNGLRGYPAREFTGTRRTRLNLEDRVDTGLEVLSMHLGLAAFGDAGWVHDATLGQSLGTTLRSVGFGLRVGSSHLLGSRILRLDVAWPLDDPYGHGYGVSVSFAVGQVFSFFGNASNLGSEF